VTVKEQEKAEGLSEEEEELIPRRSKRFLKRRDTILSDITENSGEDELEVDLLPDNNHPEQDMLTPGKGRSRPPHSHTTLKPEKAMKVAGVAPRLVTKV
jgi:hypothetical protein